MRYSEMVKLHLAERTYLVGARISRIHLLREWSPTVGTMFDTDSKPSDGPKEANVPICGHEASSAFLL